MSLVLVTPPAAEPMTLQEAKDHLRVDIAADDALITPLIAAARQLVEIQTGRALITQQWKYSAPCFPSRGGAFPQRNGVISLLKSPLISVQSVKYIDGSGTEQTLAANQYVVDTDHPLGRISPASGVSWPATGIQSDAVRIAFTAGYGAAAANVPPAIVAAVKLVLGDLYASREANIVGTNVVANPTVAALLDPWRLEAFG